MAETARVNGLIGTPGIKAPVRAATIANIALTGEQTVDGVALVTGDRVLVKNQNTISENGVYDVATGAWARTPDFDGARDVVQGTRVYVVSGAVNAHSEFIVASNNPIIPGVTDMLFTSRVFSIRPDAVSVFDFMTLAQIADVEAGTLTQNVTAAIQAAIDSQAGKIYFPAGAYKVDTVYLRGDLVLHGDGAKTRFVWNSTAGVHIGLFNLDSNSAIEFISNVTLRDLAFYGKCDVVGFSEFEYLLSINGADNLLIERCSFLGFQGDGIFLGGVLHETHNQNITIRNCYFDGLNYSNRNAISVLDGTHVTIEDNYFTNCSRYDMPGAVDIECDKPWHTLNGITVHNNRFYNVGGAGSIKLFIFNEAVHGITFTNKPTNFKITKNQIDGGTHKQDAGIQIVGDNPADTPLSHDVIIEGNTVKNTLQGLVVAGVNGYTVVDNDISDTQYSPMIGWETLAANRKPYNGVVERNRFTRLGICNFDSSVVTVSIANPCVVSLPGHGLTANRRVQFTTSGALPAGLTAGVTYYVISSGLTANTFQVSATLGGTAIATSGSQSGVHAAKASASWFHSGKGLFVNDATKLVISQNTFIDCGRADGTLGYGIDFGSGTTSHLTCIGNFIRNVSGYTTYGIKKEAGATFTSSNAIQRDNILVGCAGNDLPPNYASGNFTYDLSTASGTQEITGVGFSPKEITFAAQLPGTVTRSIGEGTSCIYSSSVAGSDNVDTANCIHILQAAGAAQTATVVPTADGFILTWTKTNAPVGVISIIWRAKQ